MVLLETRRNSVSCSVCSTSSIWSTLSTRLEFVPHQKPWFCQVYNLDRALNLVVLVFFSVCNTVRNYCFRRNCLVSPFFPFMPSTPVDWSPDEFCSNLAKNSAWQLKSKSCHTCTGTAQKEPYRRLAFFPLLSYHLNSYRAVPASIISETCFLNKEPTGLDFQSPVASDPLAVTLPELQLSSF